MVMQIIDSTNAGLIQLLKILVCCNFKISRPEKFIKIRKLEKSQKLLLFYSVAAAVDAMLTSLSLLPSVSLIVHLLCVCLC